MKMKLYYTIIQLVRNFAIKHYNNQHINIICCKICNNLLQAIYNTKQ